MCSDAQQHNDIAVALTLLGAILMTLRIGIFVVSRLDHWLLPPAITDREIYLAENPSPSSMAQEDQEERVPSLLSGNAATVHPRALYVDTEDKRVYPPIRITEETLDDLVTSERTSSGNAGMPAALNG